MRCETVNTHGYKMENLEEIWFMTKDMKSGCGYYCEIAYDTETGTICIEENAGAAGDIRSRGLTVS